MGGRLGIHVATGPDAAGAAARDARRVAGRVVAWSRLLTRHDPASPLMRLNGDPNATVLVQPDPRRGPRLGRRTRGERPVGSST